MPRYDSGSMANFGKKSRGLSPYLPPNQFAQLTLRTPLRPLILFAYETGRMNTMPVLFIATRRRAPPNWEFVCSVVTTERSEANRNSASATLRMVSAVRNLWRFRFATTRCRYFTVPPPPRASR